VIVSVAVKANRSGVTVSGRRSGKTPILIRFERWMRSNPDASTARAPRRATPLAIEDEWAAMQQLVKVLNLRTQ
jgi:hypothetical protein